MSDLLPASFATNGGSIVMPDTRILVTGASGFIGAKVVEVLLERGFRNLRCFIRLSSRLRRLQEAIDRRSAGNSVELVSGDLLSRDDCRRAANGAAVFTISPRDLTNRSRERL